MLHVVSGVGCGRGGTQCSSRDVGQLAGVGHDVADRGWEGAVAGLLGGLSELTDPSDTESLCVFRAGRAGVCKEPPHQLDALSQRSLPR